MNKQKAKKNKPPPDPHREYLDAESDDELEAKGEIYVKVKKYIKNPPRFSG